MIEINFKDPQKQLKTEVTIQIQTDVTFLEHLEDN